MKPTTKTPIRIGCALLLCLVYTLAATQPKSAVPAGPKGIWHNTRWGRSFQPEAGAVPDENAAIKIAEAILLPIYGEKTINAERPLTASLKNGVWMVSGTLPEGWDGGTAVVRLSKEDGRVLFICHYQ